MPPTSRSPSQSDSVRSFSEKLFVVVSLVVMYSYGPMRPSQASNMVVVESCKVANPLKVSHPLSSTIKWAEALARPIISDEPVLDQEMEVAC